MSGSSDGEPAHQLNIGDMLNDGARLLSFTSGPRKWPHIFPSAYEVASAGFFFIGTEGAPDAVCCPSCEIELDSWERSDEPIREHLSRNPRCGFAKRLERESAERNIKVEAEWDILSDKAVLSDSEEGNLAGPSRVSGAGPPELKVKQADKLHQQKATVPDKVQPTASPAHQQGSGAGKTAGLLSKEQKVGQAVLSKDKKGTRKAA
jgi:hypothetical protein